MRIEPRVDAFDIAASGLRGQRLRMEVIANNLANANTTSATTLVLEDGTVRHIPYRRKNVLFTPGILERGERQRGVSVVGVVEDPTDFDRKYDPSHPHAIPSGPEAGYVLLPNVHPIIEFTDMIAASRAYQANVTSIEVLKAMGEATLRILA